MAQSSSSQQQEQYLQPSDAPMHERWYTKKAEFEALEASHGIKVRRGQFTVTEDILLKAQVDRFVAENGLSIDDFYDMIGGRAGGNGKARQSKQERDRFWKIIAAPFPTRPLQSVFHRVKRLYHPLNQVIDPEQIIAAASASDNNIDAEALRAVKTRGWSKEDLKQLVDLVTQHGTEWQKIGELMNRMPENCRSRYKAIREKGLGTQQSMGRVSWSSDDELLLLEVILKHLAENYQVNLLNGGDSIKVHDFVRLVKKKVREWSLLEKLYANRNPVDARISENLRSKWKHYMQPVFMNIYSERQVDQDEVVTLQSLLDQFHDWMRMQNWTIEMDKLLIQSIREKFPTAVFLGDVIWARIQDYPQFASVSQRDIIKRFKKLLKACNLVKRKDLLLESTLNKINEFLSGQTGSSTSSSLYRTRAKALSSSRRVKKFRSQSEFKSTEFVYDSDDDDEEGD
ncbi:hypothetical protein MP228_012263 [Amoeboaphelidium protococcarum]|nr:hypothetical protein MP228_012263 [Amoeboaphelidium protococcarum]